MKRLPLLPTILVGLACAAMIALGIWQLQRAQEKAELKTVYARNAAMSSITFFPVFDPVRPELYFRKAQSHCLNILGWTSRAGVDAAGKTGYRQLATCSTGVEGPGYIVDMGVSDSFDAPKGYTGGDISGTIVPGISSGSLFQRMIGKAPIVPPMLIADTPAPGLRASKVPTIDDMPDNHLAYAVQWFIFAGLAALIYFLALRRRWSKDLPPR